MSGCCNECGNVLCLCDKDKPNNKFKHGDWVVGSDVVFRIDDIRVHGDSFGYSNHNMDGFFAQKDLLLAGELLIREIRDHLNEFVGKK